MVQEKASRRVAFLDRDGTIIFDRVYLSDPDEIEFTPRALDGLRVLRDAGFELVLITNQSGLARGYFDGSVLDRIHHRLQSILAADGLSLRGIYVCPHGPDDRCDCRKPAPGLLLRAMRELEFDPSDAVLIGDSDVDMRAAAAAGVKGVRMGGGSLSADVADFLQAAQRACALFSEREVGKLACI